MTFGARSLSGPRGQTNSSLTIPAGIPRALTTGFCRLCHGKFSSRSLRNAFGKVPMVSEDSEKQRRLDQVFFTDFQRLVGVTVQQDPSLPPFVCKKCHAQFYKCRSILKAFIQKVNVSPAEHPKPRGKYVEQPSLLMVSVLPVSATRLRDRYLLICPTDLQASQNNPVLIGGL